MGLATSKAARQDRRRLRALLSNSLGEMDAAGRGHGVANILEPAAHWLKQRAAIEEMARENGGIKHEACGIATINSSSTGHDNSADGRGGVFEGRGW